jgi:hypothetical protein
MSKTQGWIIVCILFGMLIIGLAYYGEWHKKQNDEAGQGFAVCLNQCHVQGQVDINPNNSCLQSCVQERGLSPDFLKGN